MERKWGFKLAWEINSIASESNFPIVLGCCFNALKSAHILNGSTSFGLSKCYKMKHFGSSKHAEANGTRKQVSAHISSIFLEKMHCTPNQLFTPFNPLPTTIFQTTTFNPFNCKKKIRMNLHESLRTLHRNDTKWLFDMNIAELRIVLFYDPIRTMYKCQKFMERLTTISHLITYMKPMKEEKKKSKISHNFWTKR